MLRAKKLGGKHTYKSKFVIGKEGGEFSYSSVRVIIPPGALSEDVEFSVYEVKSGFPAGPITTPINISPDIKFNKPVKIYFTIDAGKNDFIAFLDGNRWFPLQTFSDREGIYALTDHLSTWTVVSFPSTSSDTYDEYSPPTITVPAENVYVFEASSSSSLKKYFVGRYVYDIVPDGRYIWFSDQEQAGGVSANWIGRLDTQTGQVKVWVLPFGTGVADIEKLGKDIWISLRTGPDLVKFDPQTEQFTYYRIPPYIGSWPYDIDISDDGKIWVAVTVGNAVAEFDPATGTFTRMFRVPVVWTAGVKWTPSGVWVTSTYPCKSPFFFSFSTNVLYDWSIPICQDRELIARGENLIEIFSSIYEFSGSAYRVYDLGFPVWSKGDVQGDILWLFSSDEIFSYDMTSERILERVSIPASSSPAQAKASDNKVYVSLRGIYAIGEWTSGVGCDKTCGGGFEGTPLISAGSNLFVNLSSGNLYIPLNLIFSFDEFFLGFSIFYNSLDRAVDGDFGRGWVHTFSVNVEGDNGLAVVKFFDGKVVKFRREESIYVPEPFAGSSLFKSLERTSTGWILRLKGGTVFEFEGRRISKIKDVKGRKWEIVYDEGRIYEIKDPVSRSVKFGWRDGRIAMVVDPAGNTWEFFYDGEYLASVRDPLGNFAHFGYDESGRLTEYIDFGGSRWIVVYDKFGRVLQVLDPLGRPLVIEYVDDQVIRVRSRRGYMSEYIVSHELSAVLKVRDAVGAEKEYSYDLRGNMIRFKDARGYVWEYEYENSNLISSKDPLGQREEWYYNFADLVTAYIDKAGHVTRYFYEGGNLVRKVDALGNQWLGEYNELGLLIKETLPTGAQREYVYDSFKHPSVMVDALGNIWSYEYDILGMLKAETDPLGNTTRYEYDALGRMIRKIDALGNVWEYEYDARGNKVAEKTPLGNTTRYFYDFAGNLTAEVDPLGNVSRTEYDADGQRIKSTDFRGNPVFFEYDPVGRLVKFINQLGGETLNEYDAEGNVILTLHPSGLKVEYEYDPLGRVVVTRAGGVETRYEYNVLGNIIKVEVGERTTRFEYDALGRLVREIDPAGNERVYEYDSLGRPVKIVEPDGSKIQYEYDAEGRLVKIINPDGTRVVYEYDPLGRMTVFVDETGARTEYKYDALGNIIAIISPDGGVTRYGYDALGRRIWVEDPEGNITRFEYDAKGNLIAEIRPGGGRNEYTYDADGNLLSVTDTEGNTIFYEYNEMGFLISQTDPEGVRTEYEYDSAGRLIQITYPNGAVESFAYDAFGRVQKRVDAEGRAVEFAYDTFGNLVKVEYPDGAVEYEYDVLGRVVRKIYPDSTRVEFSYDRMGRVLSIRGKGAEILNKYDSMGRVIKRTFKIPGIQTVSVEYAYDSAGRKTLVKDPWGETRYTYDSAGRLLKVESDGLFAEFSYDKASRRVLIKYPNGVETRYEFCKREECERSHLLLGIRVLRGDEILWYAKYSYDRRDFIVSRDESKRRIDYSYDRAGRIISVNVYNKENPKRSYRFYFGYDSTGNRKFMELSAEVEGLFDPMFPRPKDKEPVLKHPVRIEYTYNKANEIVGLKAVRTVDGSVWYRVQFSHDLRGNLSSKTVWKDDESYTTLYQHDLENKLVKISFPEGERSEFSVLKGFVLREIYVDDDGEDKVVNFIYDGDHVLLELDEEGKPIKRYVLSDKMDEILWVKKFGDGGGEGQNKGKVEMSKDKGKGRGSSEDIQQGMGKDRMEEREREYVFYHYEHVGSTVILTDLSGDIVAEYEYSPFGEVLMARGPEAKKNLYLFTGRKYIKEAGLYDFRARIMDPRLGRFLEKDPICMEMDQVGHLLSTCSPSTCKPSNFTNLYMYANNNPVMFIDPTGKLPVWAWVAIGAGVIVISGAIAGKVIGDCSCKGVWFKGEGFETANVRCCACPMWTTLFSKCRFECANKRTNEKCRFDIKCSLLKKVKEEIEKIKGGVNLNNFPALNEVVKELGSRCPTTLAYLSADMLSCSSTNNFKDNSSKFNALFNTSLIILLIIGRYLFMTRCRRWMR